VTAYAGIPPCELDDAAEEPTPPVTVSFQFRQEAAALGRKLTGRRPAPGVFSALTTGDLVRLAERCERLARLARAEAEATR
jgi:hypothetical protein